jgi:hypothetical protein
MKSCFWCKKEYTPKYFGDNGFCSRECSSKHIKLINILNKTSKSEILKLERERKIIDILN